MTAATVTTIHLSPEDFQARLDQAVAKAVAKAVAAAADKGGETWGYKEMAARYGVSVRTIAAWAKIPGRLPPRTGSRWLARPQTRADLRQPHGGHPGREDGLI